MNLHRCLLFGILMVFVLSTNYSQTTFFTENFGTSGCAIPTGWSSTGGINWDYSTADPGRGPGGDHTTGTGCYAQLDDSDGASARHLITPSTDLTGYVPTLTFWLFNNNGDGGTPLNPVSEYSILHIDVSTDGGTNFTNDVATYGDDIPTEDYGVWTELTVDLTSYASASTVIRFRADEGSSFYSDLSLDDIELTGVIACTYPSATYTIVDDCGNGQFSVDVNVTSIGDATGVNITDGTTTYETNVGTGTYSIGPFTAGDDQVIQVNGSTYGGCDISSGTLSEACECNTTPTASVNAVNLDCSAPDYDIEVTVTNFGSGTSCDIYIDNTLAQSSAVINNTYTFAGYAPGSHNIEIRAAGASFVTCTESYTVNETCNGSETCASAPDISNDCASGDLTSAVADGGSLIENYMSCGNGNTIALCGANAGFTGSSYSRTDHADIWYQISPNGADEFTVNISNLSGGQIMILPYLTNGTCPSLAADNATMETHIGNTGSSLTGGNCPYFTSDGSLTFTGTDLTTASVVYLRIMAYANNGSGATNCETLTYPTFDICTTIPAANDVDNDAIEIDGTTSTGNLCNANVEVESTETGDLCAASQDANDLWYKVTAGASDPNASTKISVTFTNASDAVVITEFWGAFTNAYEECVILTSTGAGSTVSHTFADEIPGGSTNYYRVTPVSGNAVCDFTIGAERVVANDVCAHFSNVLPGYDVDNGTHSMNFNFASASGYDGYTGKDLWYAVDHNSNQSITISTAAQTPDWDGEVALILYEYPSALTVDCNNLVEYCSQTGVDDFDLESGITFNLGTGDYLLRVVETTTDPSNDELNTDITGVTSAATILSNSSCDNALDISSTSKTGNFSQAQLACPSASITCGATTYNSLPSDAYYGAALWYQFTMPGTACSGAAPTTSLEIRSVEISVSGLSTSSGAGTKNAYIELYSDCNTLVECGQTINNSTNVSFSGLTTGATYYLRIINNTLTSTSTSDFTVEAIIPGDPAPCNDYSSDSYSLSVINDLDVANLTIYSADGATTSEFTDDVWFDFTAPAANGLDYPLATADLSFVTVYAENISGDVFQVEVWDTISGVDGGFTELTTLDPQDRTLSGVNDYTFFQLGHLVPGERYFLQVKFSSPAKNGIMNKAGSNERFKLAVLNPGEDNTSLCNTGSTTKPTSITGCEGDCQAIYKFEVDATGNYQIEATGDNVDVEINVYQSDTESGGEQTESYPYDYDHPCQIDRNTIAALSTTSISSDTHGCSAGFTGERNVYNLTASTTSNPIYYFIEVIDQSASGSKHGCSGPELCELQVYAVGSSTTLYTGQCRSFSSALPVELNTFQVYKSGKNNLLHWNTLSEINNSHFEVEYSEDGYQFEVIGKVNGNGNSSNSINYQYKHLNPGTGKHYYRLMQVDFDGNRSYSNIVSINRTNESIYSVYPNPSKGVYNLEIGKQENTSIIVKNTLGQVIRSANIIGDKYVLDLSSEPNGIYFLYFKSSSNSESFKVIKR